MFEPELMGTSAAGAGAKWNESRRADGGIACDDEGPFVDALEHTALHDVGRRAGGDDAARRMSTM